MRTPFATAIARFIPVHAIAGDMQPMSIDQMKAEIVGNSLSGMTDHGEDYIEHYRPDGRIAGISKAAGRYEGTWSFRQDGLMCFRYGEDALAGGCGPACRAWRPDRHYARRWLDRTDRHPDRRHGATAEVVAQHHVRFLSPCASECSVAAVYQEPFPAQTRLIRFLLGIAFVQKA